MVSNISEERLVIAAIKGDHQAMELLKERLKPSIRNLIKRGARSYNGDMEILEAHTLEELVNSLEAYQFTDLSKVGYGCVLLTRLTVMFDNTPIL